MTGKHLPPDTGREITTLKRRVSDLERMLDRARRDTATQPAEPWPAFTCIEGSGGSIAGAYLASSGWTYYHPANPIDRVVPDPTGHLAIEADPVWYIRFAVAGVYEIGTAAASGTYLAGRRHLAIQRDDNGELTHHRIAVVPAAAGVQTYLSGSRVVIAPAGSRWTVSFGDDSGENLGGECTSFWARAVSVTTPVAGDIGSM